MQEEETVKIVYEARIIGEEEGDDIKYHLKKKRNPKPKMRNSTFNGQLNMRLIVENKRREVAGMLYGQGATRMQEE